MYKSTWIIELWINIFDEEGVMGKSQGKKLGSGVGKSYKNTVVTTVGQSWHKNLCVQWSNLLWFIYIYLFSCRIQIGFRF